MASQDTSKAQKLTERIQKTAKSVISMLKNQGLLNFQPHVPKGKKMNEPPSTNASPAIKQAWEYTCAQRIQVPYVFIVPGYQNLDIVLKKATIYNFGEQKQKQSGNIIIFRNDIAKLSRNVNSLKIQKPTDAIKKMIDDLEKQITELEEKIKNVANESATKSNVQNKTTMNNDAMFVLKLLAEQNSKSSNIFELILTDLVSNEIKIKKMADVKSFLERNNYSNQSYTSKFTKPMQQYEMIEPVRQQMRESARESYVKLEITETIPQKTNNSVSSSIVKSSDNFPGINKKEKKTSKTKPIALWVSAVTTKNVEENIIKNENDQQSSKWFVLTKESINNLTSSKTKIIDMFELPLSEFMRNNQMMFRRFDQTDCKKVTGHKIFGGDEQNDTSENEILCDDPID